jgi:hypothetical protein
MSERSFFIKAFGAKLVQEQKREPEKEQAPVVPLLCPYPEQSGTTSKRGVIADKANHLHNGTVYPGPHHLPAEPQPFLFAFSPVHSALPLFFSPGT